MSNKDHTNLRVAMPKGRMFNGVVNLLNEAGIKLRGGERDYRPSLSLPSTEVKILKPQNVVRMLDAGSRDVGFAGADWVKEIGADIVELLDTSLDPVRLVAAVPQAFARDGLPSKVVVASEYEVITKEWIAKKKIDAHFVRSYGATEVFPPEDADLIVDNTATGSTLRANGLEIIDDVMRSSTRLYASKEALADPVLSKQIDSLVLLLKSVLAARSRLMVELNVDKAQFEKVISLLPSMREPTVSELHSEAGYSVRSAVPKDTLPTLIPLLKENGARDIVVSAIAQISS